MAPHAIDHVLLLTDDVEATRAFYCDVLGFEVGGRPPLPFAGCWLYTGSAPSLHVADRAEYAAWAAGIGLHVDAAVDHVAFAAGDYDELVERLRAAGVDATPNEVPGLMRQLYVTDPNGVRIEVNVRS